MKKIMLTKDQHGLAVIEFALVLPILVVLLLATAEFSRAFYQYNTLTKAIRDGARYLSDNSLNGAGVIELNGSMTSTTKNLVVFGNSLGNGAPLLEDLSVNDITITPLNSMHVKVAASYTYKPIFAAGIPSFGLGSQTYNTDFTLESSTTVRAL
ncbi:MAG: TadE family protein [Gammaproteobacteria bacterium]